MDASIATHSGLDGEAAPPHPSHDPAGHGQGRPESSPHGDMRDSEKTLASNFVKYCSDWISDRTLTENLDDSGALAEKLRAFPQYDLLLRGYPSVRPLVVERVRALSSADDGAARWRVILGELDRLIQSGRASGPGAAGEKEEEAEEEAEEEDSEEEAEAGPRIDKRLVRDMARASVYPLIWSRILARRNAPIIHWAFDGAFLVRDVLKPRFEAFKDRVVAMLMAATNAPYAGFSGFQRLSTRHRVLGVLFLVLCTVLLPGLVGAMIAIFVLRIFLRPTKILDPLLDGVEVEIPGLD